MSTPTRVNYLTPQSVSISPSSCDGCGETDLVLYPLTSVWLVHTPTGQILHTWACSWCLEVVDHCDPVTGAYGAAACEHRRATDAEIKAHVG